MKRPQRPEAKFGQPSPLQNAFLVGVRDRYASRALAYVILLNGAAALILVTALALAPQSAADPRRLSWAMLVFGCGALAGLLVRYSHTSVELQWRQAISSYRTYCV